MGNEAATGESQSAKTAFLLSRVSTQFQGCFASLFQFLVLSGEEEASESFVCMENISAREGTHLREHGMELLKEEGEREGGKKRNWEKGEERESRVYCNLRR